MSWQAKELSEVDENCKVCNRQLPDEFNAPIATYWCSGCMSFICTTCFGNVDKRKEHKLMAHVFKL